MKPHLQVLWVGGTVPDLSSSPFGPFATASAVSLDEAARVLSEKTHDAVVVSIDADTDLPSFLHWPALSHAVLESAVVVVSPSVSPDIAERLVGRGVQDLLPADAANAATLGRVLRLSVARKRMEMAARKAYAIDLATGLPNHSQLLEHMTHLLALREREPAPMALLVLRIEGLATTEMALGAEAAGVLRRKVAVRLRAGLRASDVVASIGGDAFAVLLAWIDAPGDGLRVAAKLAAALRESFKVAGQDRVVAVGFGVSQYPEHGKRAEELLRRAMGQATGAAAVGREGFTRPADRGAAGAANDER
jgi:diguanylate cyclase (GGDEF)-like protein